MNDDNMDLNDPNQQPNQQSNPLPGFSMSESSSITGNIVISDSTIAALGTKFSAGIMTSKLKADIEIARRRQNLEELKATHQMAMEDKIQNFREAELLRKHKIVDDMFNENWMKAYWRPAAGWVYLAICAFDFILAPVMMAVLPAFIKGVTYVPWKSLTLENGGIIHLAFAAILGVTSWTKGMQRTQFNAMLADEGAVESKNTKASKTK